MALHYLFDRGFTDYLALANFQLLLTATYLLLTTTYLLLLFKFGSASPSNGHAALRGVCIVWALLPMLGV